MGIEVTAISKADQLQFGCPNCGRFFHSKRGEVKISEGKESFAELWQCFGCDETFLVAVHSFLSEGGTTVRILKRGEEGGDDDEWVGTVVPHPLSSPPTEAVEAETA
ncbi:hypothetical protein COY93_03470 [Candidatus Uhrbacteria bacterium CG_4_10_14_0_8_um_filter_58_22]|uniref:Uncharacterized protein n=1 Tax=Candidatus Uhrbacteria bacterium CG_4_10_14_0_8_um_filter_58_22 TaxID=1975029 RepID=A0A2M7QAB3_9BACT|nr:MAG: hypothetical protein AUJ19_02840 [Parcubacteria group bacterium CG1_02_58_44]PIY62294.1 MAG: hypothetical protein COY93_03470 [Candidatus Uhrbacteria bacterium CG_4_10_14_0_8_um_filter_58_22]